MRRRQAFGILSKNDSKSLSANDSLPPKPIEAPLLPKRKAGRPRKVNDGNLRNDAGQPS